MKNSIIRKLDGTGRIMVPKELRDILGLTPDGEVQLIFDSKKIVIKKHITEDSLGRLSENEPYYSYRGRKVSRSTIVELANLAGLID